MPKLYGFYSKEAEASCGQETVTHYLLASDPSKSVKTTHVSEDIEAAEYHWADKTNLGEVTEHVKHKQYNTYAFTDLPTTGFNDFVVRLRQADEMAFRFRRQAAPVFPDIDLEPQDMTHQEAEDRLPFQHLMLDEPQLPIR